jgi:hypothetical protein
MKQTAVEWLAKELKKYGIADIKDQSNYVSEMPTHILNEFIPYELALALKELGFDEPCFGYYLNKKLNIFHNTYVNDRINSKTKDIFSSDVIVTPLYQQAFKWFRDNYGILSSIQYRRLPNIFWFKIDDAVFNDVEFKTYEEAELECLKKLIEIVKNK